MGGVLPSNSLIDTQWAGGRTRAADSDGVSSSSGSRPALSRPDGIGPAPGWQLLVADAGKGVVDADTGALVASLPGVTDIAPIGRGDMLALTSAFAPGTHRALYRVSKGSARKLADLQQYEVENDPAATGPRKVRTRSISSGWQEARR